MELFILLNIYDRIPFYVLLTFIFIRVPLLQVLFSPRNG
jgi:hypothetical protein